MSTFYWYNRQIHLLHYNGQFNQVYDEIRTKFQGTLILYIPLSLELGEKEIPTLQKISADINNKLNELGYKFLTIWKVKEKTYFRGQAR